MTNVLLVVLMLFPGAAVTMQSFEQIETDFAKHKFQVLLPRCYFAS